MEQGEEHFPSPLSKLNVSLMSSLSYSQEKMRALLKDAGVDLKTDATLCKHYRHEIDHGTSSIELNMAAKVYYKAIEEGNLQALMFWLKTRTKGNWTESKGDDSNLTVIEMLINQIKPGDK